MIAWLRPGDPFPPLVSAMTDPNGLLAAGLELHPARLLDAYRQGIFPWFSDGEPVLWWSPAPRMVLFTDELRVTRSLAKTLAHRRYSITVDTDFPRVMCECAAPTPARPSSWITGDIIAAYTELHRMGHAHSVETRIDGELVGGLYGIMLGRMFFGESMFSRASDGSKLAFVHLVRRLAAAGVPMIDCQMKTAHLASLGGREISRDAFVARLKPAVDAPAPAGLWNWRHDNEPSR